MSIFTIRLSNMCVDTNCRHSMYSVCTSWPFVVPVVFLCVTFLGVLLSVCFATNVWKGVLLCDAIYLRVFIVVTRQWDELTAMRGRRYIDSLDEANVAGLCKTTGLATITLTHLAYFFSYFLLPCMRFFTRLHQDWCILLRQTLLRMIMIFFLANSTCGKWQTLRGGPKFTAILFVAMFLANICRSQNVARRDSRESSVSWLFVNALFVPFVN